MSQLLHLATPNDLAKISTLVTAHFSEDRSDTPDTKLESAIAPLLEGSPHGAIWLIGPRMAPVGYVMVSFGWSLALAGLTGEIDAFWIRPKVRKRGMGTEALTALQLSLRDAGIQALSLSCTGPSRDTQLYTRCGFAERTGTQMTWLATDKMAEP